MSRIKKMLSKLFFYRKLGRRNKLGFAVFTIITLLTASIYAWNAFHPESTSAAWFDDNWGYRQAITVTVSSSASDITELETLITVDTTGITSKVRTNCEDLRFTNAGGKVLPYYIDSCTNNSATNKIWVLADLVPKNTTTYTIYMYYGNASANSLSDTTKFNLFRGLVGYFTVNDGSGGSSADSSVTGTNGTINIGASGTQTTTTQAWSNGAAGNYSGSLNFDGTDDRINISSSAYALTNALTLSAWIYPTTSTGSHNIFSNGNPWDYRLYQGGLNLTMQVSLDDGNTGYHTASNVLTANTWQHVVGVFTGSRKQIYVNGVQVLDVAHSGTIQTPASSLVIASYGSGEYFQGQIDDARVYNRGLSQEEVIALYNNPGEIATTAPATSKPTTAFATEEKSPAPVAYWKFDEGTGTVANDSSSNKSNGTITGATWQTEDQCISGKCLSFDGTDDGVDTNKDFSWDNTTGAFTISTWIKPNSVTGDHGIIGKTSWEYVLLLDDNKVEFDYWNTAGASIIAVESTTSIETNKWYHVEVVFDGTTAKLYINGNLEATDSSIVGTFQNRTETTKIGYSYTNHGSGAGTSYFPGFIDEPKIYNYARTAAQVKADYASRGSVKGTSAQMGSNNQLSSALSNGLVGYWKQDEATWSGTLNEVVDSSGNGNHGQAAGATGGKAYPTSAKFGNGGYFDGVDDYISTSVSEANGTYSRTFSAWIYGVPTSGRYEIANLRNTFFNIQDNKICIYIYGANSVYLCSTASLTSGQWNHVAATFDNTTNTEYVFVNGAASGNLAVGTPTTSAGSTGTIGVCVYCSYGFKFSGKIDEARIYNRALSGAEVSQLYNWAPGPITYYNFEEGNGNAVNDTSGNGLTGTMTSGSTWASGKFGKAGNFNGTSARQGVQVSNNALLDPGTGSFTTEAWIKTSQTGTVKRIVTKRGSSSTWYSMFIQNGKLDFETAVSYPTYYTTGAGNRTINDGQWHHVVMVRDTNQSKVLLYVDGVLDINPTDNTAGQSITNNEIFEIGIWGNEAYDTGSYTGRIDDVKIYNYARTAKQIVSDMNAGHPNVGSPVGSAIGYWKFDEGYGTQTNNSGNSGNTYAGTLTNSPTWTNDGKLNKALSITGTQNVNIPDGNGALDFDTNDFTISAWIKTSSTGDNRNLIHKGAGAGISGWRFGLASGRPHVLIGDTVGPTEGYTGPTSVADGTWHLVTVVFDRDTGAIGYVDGKATGTVLNIISRNGSVNNSSALLVTANTYGGFTGLVDDVKMYNYALTSDEVKLEYNRGSTQVLGSLSDTSGLTGGSVASNSASAEYCIPGDSTSCAAPVGRWDFEEGNGGTVNDRSGNNYSATLTNSPNWVSAKIGKGMQFSPGTTQRASSAVSSGPLTALNDHTLGFWIKFTNTADSATLYRRVTGYSITAGNDRAPGVWICPGNSSSLGLYWRFGPSNFGFTCWGPTGASSVFNTNTWYYMTVTKSGTTATYYVNGVSYGTATVDATMSSGNGEWDFGYDGTYSAAGMVIDNVKLFNYARTPAQVAWDYNRGAPVGHWKMDECQGGTANDSSGNGNHGTITIGGTGTQTSAGTCTTASTAWGNGATGKYNSSLNFDGTDDYINIPSLTWTPTTFSASFWLKPTTVTSYNQVIGATNGWGAFNFHTTSTGGVYVGTDVTNRMTPTELPAGTITTGQWQHFIFTYSSGTGKFYKNGALLSTKTGMVNPTAWGGFKIGAGDSGTINGQADDVRIYNYPLTKQQVQQVYNQGSAVRFGPSQGTP